MTVASRSAPMSPVTPKKPIAPPPGLAQATSPAAPGLASPFEMRSLFIGGGAAAVMAATATRSPEKANAGGAHTSLDNPIAEAMRQAVIQEVEEEMTQKLTEVWQKGAQEAQSLQHASEQKADDLAKAVADFRDAQNVLEAENAQLKGKISGLAAWMNSVLSGDAPAEWPNAAALGAAQGSSTSGSGDSYSTNGLETNSGSSGGSLTPPAMVDLTPAVVGMPMPAASDMPAFVNAPGTCPTAALGVQWPEPPAEVAPFHFSASAPAWPAPSTVSPCSPPFSIAAPAAAPACSPTLSIADALGIAKQEESPLIPLPLSECPPGLPVPQQSTDFRVSAPPSLEEGVDGFIFQLTLRVAEGAGIGLTTSHSAASGPVLQIQQVIPGGAAEAWNRQCSSSGAGDRVLHPGDRIVSVNKVAGDPLAMVQEMESRQLVKLHLVRTRIQPAPKPQNSAKLTALVSTSIGSPPPTLPPSLPPSGPPAVLGHSPTPPPPLAPPAISSPGSPPSSPSKLRVEANVFVPMSAVSPVCAAAAAGCDLSGVVDSPEGRRLIESML